MCRSRNKTKSHAVPDCSVSLYRGMLANTKRRQQHNDKCRVPTYLSATRVNTDGQKYAGLQINNSRSPRFTVTARSFTSPSSRRDVEPVEADLTSPCWVTDTCCSDFSEILSVFRGEQWNGYRREWDPLPQRNVWEK